MADFSSRYDFEVVPGLSFSRPSMTRQEFKDECDINTIMRRMVKSGMVPVVDGARYGDFANVGDFREAQELVIRARKQFDALPSEAREKFKHDPGEMLRWVHDKGTTLEDAKSIGLLSEEGIKKVDAKAAAAAAVPDKK